MNQRSSNNAKSFAGKNWSVNSKKTSLTKEEIALKKKLAQELRNKKKQERKNERWLSLCKKFNIENPNEYKAMKTIFLNISKDSLMLKTLQNVKSFRLYCKKYNEKFSLENYLENKFFSIDYKIDFPDVYYFNVKKNMEKNKYELEKKFFDWFTKFHFENLKFEPKIIEITETNIIYGMKKHMGRLVVSIEKIENEMKTKTE